MANEKGGSFVWHDLMTTDSGAAQDFYKKVVGWGTQKWKSEKSEPHDPEYTMWTAGEAPIGGVIAHSPIKGAPPHWLAYISTPDVDAAVKKTTSLGGKVLKEAFDIPEVGRLAVLADPQGAAFSAFTPLQSTSSAPPSPGHFSWHELNTTDAVAGYKFYEDLFGWNKSGEFDMGGGNMYQRFGEGETMFGGMSNQTQAPPHWLHYVMVDSADAAAERATKAGGQVVLEPMEVPGGDRIAIISDPQGALIGVQSKAAD